MKSSTFSVTLFAGIAYGLQSCTIKYANQTEPFEQFGYFGKGELLGCREVDMGSHVVNTRLGPRQQAYDTNMAYSEKVISTYTFPQEADPIPLTFGRRIDRMFNEACSEVDCDPTVRVCEPQLSPPGENAPNVCATVQGEFIDLDMRGDFVNLIRSAHGAGLNKHSHNPGTSIETLYCDGSSRIAVTTTKGDYSGFNMAVKFELEYAASECPTVIDKVSNALSNIPEIGAVFGLINVLCSSLN